MRCFLVMMDETRRVILDSGGEGGDERVGEERGGSGDFFGGEHGWLFVVVEVTCFGRLLDDSRGPGCVCLLCT